MDYKLRPIGKTCASSGEPLEPGSVCYSVVIERQGQFVREDYSEKAWQGPPENALGFWQSIVPNFDKGKPKVLDSEALMQYFEQLSEEGNEAAEKNRYVIALMLLQKRRLIIEDSRQDGEEEFLICSGKQGEGPFEIKNFALPEGEVKELQDQLRASLSAA
ncbi:MAG: hypothetical protein KDA65_10465 [Planctomycetaceae bacterium]|nr:hypothetical protein [Planctomycetaceae bacterium]